MRYTAESRIDPTQIRQRGTVKHWSRRLGGTDVASIVAQDVADLTGGAVGGVELLASLDEC